MPDPTPLEMTISLNVLNHLGIGLYSNIPAVLSEVVANAWDADAEHVDIQIDTGEETITILDDGVGMTRPEINQKFLNVGYRKREEEGPKTKVHKRHVMGRKGIGKLSVFSIARRVEVVSERDGAKTGFVMDRDDIRRQIENAPDKPYRPDEIDTSTVTFPKGKGTRLRLRDFDKRINWTETYLRRRLARRFSVIGSRHNFEVSINGNPLTAKDRDFYRDLEFVWHFGERPAWIDDLSEVHSVVELDNHILIPDAKDPDTLRKERVSGWIGTVVEPSKLDEPNNAIVVMAHGKLVQEDILHHFGEAGVYADYLIGEIEAEFLDADDQDDIITSGRQNVKENDPRFRALAAFIGPTLKEIKNRWTDLRKERGTQKATENPAVKAWYDHLGGDNKKYAKKLFGKLESLNIPDPAAKTQLYRSSLLAFEKLALKDSLSVLESLETQVDFDALRALIAGMDDLEATHYYEIIRGRMEVLREFQDLLPESKERVVQEYLFDHLWLIEASWERAAANPRIEEAVTTEFEDVTDSLSLEERRGRIDIRYRTAAGKHIIIELKKYDRSVDVYELAAQLRKYRSALAKCLKEKFPKENRQIEMISVLGRPPRPLEEPEVVEDTLNALNARFVTYDDLIKNALESYSDYLARQREVSTLIALIEEIDFEGDNAAGGADRENEAVEPGSM